MKYFITLILALVFSPNFIIGQSGCDKLIKDARALISKRKFNDAIATVEAAKGCTAQSEIDKLYNEIFGGLQKQTLEAEASKRKALEQEKIAKENLNKANTLISYFGFTENRAWAYKNGKFAIIDRNGKRLTDFLYENPEPFHENGYAIAQRGVYFHLVDTNGQASIPYSFFFPTNNGLYIAYQDNKLAFLDREGKPLTSWGWFEDINDFCDGVTFLRKNGKYILVNKNGVPVIPNEFEGASDFGKEKLAWFKYQNKWGLINTKGKILIQPQFESRSERDLLFENGFAIVKQGFKFGLVDTTGKILFEPKFNSISILKGGFLYLEIEENGKRFFTWGDRNGKYLFPFQEFIHTVRDYQSNFMKFVNNSGKWGLVGKDGLIFSPQFDKLDHLSEYNKSESIALAMIKKDDKWGLIDTFGRIILLSTFDSLFYRRNLNEYFKFKKDGKLGLVNIYSRKIIVEPQYDEINESYKGIKVQKNGKWGLIDTNGIVILLPLFDKLEILIDNKIKIQQYGKWGLANSTGQIIISPQFEFLNSNLSMAKQNNLWGLINNDGKFIEEPQFDTIKPSNIGTFFSKKNGKWGSINKESKIILPHKYEDIIGGINKKIISIKEQGKWGLIDSNGLNILEPQFDKMQYSYNNSICIQKNGKWGLLDSNLQILIKPQFDEINYIDGGFYSIVKNGKYGLLSDRGEIFLQPEYDNPIKFNIMDKDRNYYKKYNYDDVEGFAWTKKGGKLGLVSKTGQILLEPQFENREPPKFQEGVAWVQIGGRFGLIDKKGQILIPPKFEAQGSDFINGKSHAKKHGATININKKGEFIVDEEPNSEKETQN